MLLETPYNRVTTDRHPRVTETVRLFVNLIERVWCGLFVNYGQQIQSPIGTEFRH